jgi:two-component system LytT family sensor kinase
MNTNHKKNFKKAFAKTNLFCVLAGIAIALLIIIFECAINNGLIPARQMLANMLFSIIITLSIGNSICLFECYWRRGELSPWKTIGIYYACNLLGMLVGIELSYLAMAVIFHVPYTFLNHFSDYRFNFLVVLVISTVVYVYRSQQSNLTARLKEKELDLVKVKQLITQAELQTLQSKINPHFLYNSLNSIASLIHEDANKAEEMTLKLSKLFRYSINSSQENMATITDEMEIVNTYLAIEKVRFGDRLGFTDDVEENIKNAMIPRFLIQPLVENALKHGLNDMAANGELKISIILLSR